MLVDINIIQNIFVKSIVHETSCAYTPLFGSKVDKLSKIFINTSKAMEYIESDIQNIEAPRIDDPIM